MMMNMYIYPGLQELSYFHLVIIVKGHNRDFEQQLLTGRMNWENDLWDFGRQLLIGPFSDYFICLIQTYDVYEPLERVLTIDGISTKWNIYKHQYLMFTNIYTNTISDLYEP